jgi:hypothetical protein
MNKHLLLGKLSPFTGQKKMIVADQDVYDIIRAILNAHKLYATEYDKISNQFYRGNAKETARAIFNFLKDHINYKIDPGTRQQIMSPSAIISIGKNDCKNFALFIVGILQSLKRKGILKNDSFFRFASYKLLDEIPHHVFAVVIDDQGKEIWVDPVLSSFDEKKSYYHKIDKKINMPLYSISGTHDQVGSLKTFFLKFGLAPARGAFELLLGINAFQTAKHLDQKLKLNKDAVKSWWENLGGNFNTLLKKIQQGAKKKGIFGVEDHNEIGIAPVVIAAMITSATPILIKLSDFLKKQGTPAADLAALQAGYQQGVKGAIQDAAQNNAAIPNGSTINVPALPSGTLVSVPSGTDTTTNLTPAVSPVPANTNPVSTAITKNYLPYIIVGGGLVLYLMTRKKR